MKKSLMILASVALGASMASAQNVESKNVVGFNTIALPTPGSTLIGMNWQNPDGTSLNVQDIFDPTNLYTGADVGEVDCDQIIFWDPTLSDGAGDYATFYFWDAGEGGTWYDLDGVPQTFDVNPGEAFWFVRQTANGSDEVVVKGQVATNASISLSAPVGWRLFSSAFPVVPYIGEGIAGYAGEDVGDAANCDEIIIWDSTLNEGQGDYMTYYYMSNGETSRWYDLDGQTVEDLEAKILLGTGAWYLNQGASAVTWSQNNPL